MKILIRLSLILSLNFPVYADDFITGHIFQMDSNFTHHAILVEKSTHRLFLFQNEQGTPKLLKTFQVATGKIRGNKFNQGDHKTPEGIYTFKEFHSGEELKAKFGEVGNMYGAGAFTTNYPNLMDKRQSKTGGGIWLHSTDDASRISKGLDSRGCVVTNDLDLKDISKFVELKKTPIIIVETAKFLLKDTWEKEKAEIAQVIQTWSNAWISKNFNDYINQYSSEEFVDKVRGPFKQFKNYKMNIFSIKDNPEIEFSDLSILMEKDYVVATMKQNYASKLVRDIGKKVLYLKKDSNYNWKIVGEEWKKLAPENHNISFSPSMRFFRNDEI